MPRRDHAPPVLRVVAVLVLTTLLGAAPADAGGPERDITMRDNWYSPATAVVAQGQVVEFTNFGGVAHDAQDGSGLDLFGTDLLGPPETATVGPLPGAGRYRYYCTFHPEMTGRLEVPVKVNRSQSPAGAEVTVRWAAAPPPVGMVFDVQRRRPGTLQFASWRSGITSTAAKWWPSTRGRWAIRARVRMPANGESSGWSPARILEVT